MTMWCSSEGLWDAPWIQGATPLPVAAPTPPATPPGLVDPVALALALALASARTASGCGVILSTDPPVPREVVDTLSRDSTQLSCPDPDSKGSGLFLSTSPVVLEPQQTLLEPAELEDPASGASSTARLERRSAASLPASPGSEGSRRIAEDTLQYCPGEMLKRSAELIPEPAVSATVVQHLPCLLGATRKVLTSSFNAADITPEKVVKPGSSKVHNDELEAPADVHAKPVLAELGSSALPTVGSMTHGLGSCKPCAFVFKDGCQSGVDCKFCHLCEPGEKRRRKKDWKEARRFTAAPVTAVLAY